jgi:hypothetical protein
VTTSPIAGLVRTYGPADVAEALGCSEWWVRKEARQRRIPFSWIGGGYRFTAEHVTEIVRLCEIRPVVHVEAVQGKATRPAAVPIGTSDTPSVRLQARIPPRLRRGVATSEAA